jgi:hypothetical protein
VDWAGQAIGKAVGTAVAKSVTQSWQNPSGKEEGDEHL